jgi:hypothetical protein
VSPSISDLFGTSPEGATNDVDIDVNQLMSDVDKILADRPPLTGGVTPESAVPGAPAEGEVQSEIPATEVDSSTGDIAVPGAPPEPTLGATPVETAPASPPPVAIDPLSELPPERRAALLAIDQSLTDPVKRDAVLRALAGHPAETPQTVAAPQLPDHVDPESFEAQLWRQQQETNRQIAEIAAVTRQQQEQSARQIAVVAAQTAGEIFEARYAGKLTKEEVAAIAHHAGSTGIAGALAAAPEFQGKLQAAYDAALEHVLWSTEAYRDKVIGVAASAAPIPPVATVESQDRKRKLTALSSAASPISGGPAPRSSLESRPDGRLTDKSRQQVVKEAATAIARSRSEGTF